jgi:hypothetical protein
MKLLLRGATMLNTVQSIDYADNWAEQVMRQERVQLCSTEFRYDKDLLFKKCREPLFEILTKLFPPLASLFTYQRLTD